MLTTDTPWAISFFLPHSAGPDPQGLTAAPKTCPDHYSFLFWVTHQGTAGGTLSILEECPNTVQLCPFITLFQPLSPPLLAAYLMSQFVVKRGAVRMVLPPYPALSPTAPSSLL